MALALYRKYRPQTFEDVTDQNHIKITLQNEIESGKISHAYLFTGPRGVGKTTMARIFAKAINCEKRKEGKSEPCGVCENCKTIVEGKSLDIVEIDAASHTQVEHVRENVIDNARVAPSRLTYKVFIIDEVHMLSTSSFNALLKTLEEPPKQVVFILATTEVHKIPATIVSRTERFDFKKIPPKELVKRLSGIVKAEGMKVSNAVLENIARQSEGCLRDAESLLGQVLSLAGEGEKEIRDEEAAIVIPQSNFSLVSECAGYMIRRQTKEALRMVSRLENEGVNLVQFTADMLDFLRKMILVKVSGELGTLAQYFGAEIESELEEYVGAISLDEMLAIADRLIAARQGMKNKNIEKLTLEMALVEICEHASKESVVFGNIPDTIHQKSAPLEIPKKAEPPLPKPEKKTEKIVDPEPIETIASKTPVVSSGKTTLKDIKSQWSHLAGKLGEANGSLLFVLKMGQPIAIENNVLTVGFHYALHKDRASDMKNRALLERALEEVFHEPIRVESVITDVDLPKTEESAMMGDVLAPQKPANENDAALDEVLKEFGGRVVE